MLMVLDHRNLTVRLNNGVLRVYKEDKLIQRAAVKVLEMLVVYRSPMFGERLQA